jgi:hypothetical protein
LSGETFAALLYKAGENGEYNLVEDGKSLCRGVEMAVFSFGVLEKPVEICSIWETADVWRELEVV